MNPSRRDSNTQAKAKRSSGEGKARKKSDGTPQGESGSSLWRAARRKAAQAARRAAKRADTSGDGSSTVEQRNKISRRKPGQTADQRNEPGRRHKLPVGTQRKGARSAEEATSAHQSNSEMPGKGPHSGRRGAGPIPTQGEFYAQRESVERIMVARQQGARVQVGVLEDGKLVEHYVDHGRSASGSLVGNIYLGRVTGVYPGMEVAFVDIGQERGGMLHVRHVNWERVKATGGTRKIANALTKGDHVLVQVTKDPVGGKGVRLTMHVSLPGRHLVLDPAGSGSSVSRKLPAQERARLRELLQECLPETGGLIARTAAEGVGLEELSRDALALSKQWASIEHDSATKTAPCLLHGEPDLAVRVVRDIFNEGFSQLVISGDQLSETLANYVKTNAPALANRVVHSPLDTFAQYGLDNEVKAALERRVPLPSGGSLVIDHTEAMTVIDVNTGKNTGGAQSFEDTVTHTNLEAAVEIARQLRLRDIGGIIVIDFIDMSEIGHQNLVRNTLIESLSGDTTPHEVAEVTSLGLVQMTRKRVGVNLRDAFTGACTKCEGSGRTHTTN